MELAGQPEANPPVAPAFLMAQMEWREAIEEARSSRNTVALEALSRRLRHKVSVREKELASTLDEQGDFKKAAQQVNELRFYERLCTEIGNALDQLDS
jgi:molecular chaperone HscB